MLFELRYAFRQLLKSPWFSLVAIIGLGLGIGANVALFSVINSVFLRPLPYREPGRLVRLSSTNEAQNFIRAGFSYPRFLEVQERQQVFSDLAMSAGNAFTLTGRGDPEQVIGMHTTAALLPALGLEPVVGRNFSAAEDRPGGEHVALISHRMWKDKFNSDSSVLGKALTLNGAPYTIIGVLPEAATAFPLNPFQVWVPRPAEVPYLAPSQLNNGGFFFQVVARLRPGVSLEQASEAMNVIAAGYRTAHPANVDAPSKIEVVPLLDDAIGDQRQSYLMLFGAVGCVLLIACANIANLLLARFAGRRKEIAARFALGASRIRVVRQMVMESMLLALLGGALGVLLALWALGAVERFGADLIPRVVEIRLDAVALVFSTAGDPRHRALDWPAAGVSGCARQRERNTQRSQPWIDRRGPSSAREPVGRRSVALAGAAHRGRPAAHQFRPAAGRRAGIQARRGVLGADRPAAGALRRRQTGRILRTVLQTFVDAVGQYISGAR